MKRRTTKRPGTTNAKVRNATATILTATRSAADPPRPYTIGYCRPPVAAQFRKGMSGNPRGRPRGTSDHRAKALVLHEAYRLVTVREGGAVYCLPAIQAVLRSQIALAVKGNGPAQRAVIAAVQKIELDLEIEEKLRGGTAPPELTDREDDDGDGTMAEWLENDPPRGSA